MASRKHKPVHPGEILRLEFLEPMGLSAYRLSKATGISAQHLGRILKGSSGITAEVALRLARAFGTSPQLWMGLQSRYELDTAEDKRGRLIQRRVQPIKAA